MVQALILNTVRCSPVSCEYALKFVDMQWNINNLTLGPQVGRRSYVGRNEFFGYETQNANSTTDAVEFVSS